jgi:hypothetical protein
MGAWALIHDELVVVHRIRRWEILPVESLA